MAVLEDNPYGLLGFSGRVYPALRSMDPDVLYLGSFSKTFASGLRVGWALVPPAVRDRLVLAAESATLCPPTFNQLLVSRYLAGARLARPDQDVHRGLPGAARRDARARWRRTCPRVHVEHPGRGVLRVADGARGSRHEGDAAARRHRPRGVRIGHRLLRRRVRQPAAAAVVLLPTPERITEGVRRLAGVLEAEMDVMRTFGSAARPRPSIQGPQAPSPDTT